MTKDRPKPLFTWAGGKTKVLKEYQNIPVPDYQTYVEPFFGGGAFYLKEQPSAAIVNDINYEIMGIYAEVKHNPDGFIEEVNSYIEEYFQQTDRKKYYYDLRQKYWNQQSASLLYMLMKLGFNGIWQTCKASDGKFGTPAGLLRHKSADQILKRENIMQWSGLLQTTEIYSTDYKNIVIPDNSFIYLDPPYRDSFTSYGTVFGDKQQEELIEVAREWSRNSTVWLANRVVSGDKFFEDRLERSRFHYFDVTYTAGRRKKIDNEFTAVKATEFLCEVQV